MSDTYSFLSITIVLPAIVVYAKHKLPKKIQSTQISPFTIKVIHWLLQDKIDISDNSYPI